VSTLPTEIFPWQAIQWQQLVRARQQEKLAHALLFSGLDGIGKNKFARAFAHLLLCTKPSELGVWCGECHSCHMVAAGTHPDLVLIEVEEKAKNISVDQIRALIKNVNETTLTGGYRVVIIHPATAMNVNAANALLKTLEEPAAKTCIILVAEEGVRMPATIISRCQKVLFTKPEYQQALTWLKQQITDA
jgi:DNA polymerase-3 subunit delta'